MTNWLWALVRRYLNAHQKRARDRALQEYREREVWR
jgi:hypothetical protein